MSPSERLRWAVAPVQPRSTLLLWGGLALFFASGGASLLFAVPKVLLLPLYAGMLAGWLIACAGAIGTVRCLYGEASAQMRKVHAERMKDQ